MSSLFGYSNPTASNLNSGTRLGSFRIFDATGAFQGGKATMYGPNPLYLAGNEAGYQNNAVGVGCSTGPNDPNWNQILADGEIDISAYVGVNSNTVWPKTPTVAVSGFAWAKKDICWKTVTIRNKNDKSLTIEAVVVDFCPSSGCLWNRRERAWNVDIYGVRSFQALGGRTDGGNIDVEIAWPAGLKPNTSGSTNLKYLSIISWIPLQGLLLGLLLL